MTGKWTIKIGTETLADPTLCSVNPEGSGGGPVVAEYQGYGAGAPVFVNQGNGKFTSKWTLTQQWNTDTLATNFYLTGPGSWTGVNSVTLQSLDYENVTSTWLIANCKVELSVAVPIGVTTIATLTLTGGVPVLQA